MRIHHPSRPTAPPTWSDPAAIASTVPDYPVPGIVGGVAVASWFDPPTEVAGWEALAGRASFDEPPWSPVAGRKSASGAVVVEADRRVWVVSPTNRFGGYTHTFPKGGLDPEEGLSLKANALKEVLEETGLRVELTGFLADVVRTTSVTRYYVARRVGGNPADMGWESQAVHLVPAACLDAFVSHDRDKPILKALAGWMKRFNEEK